MDNNEHDQLKILLREITILNVNLSYLHTMNLQDRFIKHPNYGELSILFDKYGSDKGSTMNFPGVNHIYTWLPHAYAYIYEQLFYDKKFEIKTVFECGIGSNNESIPFSMTKSGKPGASLFAWRDYFPNATIYGADIDDKIEIKEDRIITGYMDQTNPETIDKYFAEVCQDKNFDIMIDDGCHTVDANICLFENAFKHLNKNGIYVIEDIFYSNIHKIYNNLIKNHDIDVNYCIMSSMPFLSDNNLIIIRHKS